MSFARLGNLLGRDNLEEDGEESKGWIILVRDLVCLGDRNAENPQENVPQIEAELVLNMCKYVRCTLGLVGVGVREIDTQRLLFVRVGRADRDSDGENRDVHHHQ